MTDLERVESLLRAVCAAEGRDPRTFFLRLRPGRDGAVLEASDAAVLPRLLREVSAAAPEAAIQARALPAPAWRNRVAWVAASVADVRKAASHATEQVTQALQGERLEPLLHEDGWMLCRLPDGYIGWVRDWHLRLVEPSELERFARRANARIASPLVRVREAPDPRAAPVGESPLGTPVVCRVQEVGWTEIKLPAGGRGWVRDDELRAGVEPWPATPPAVLATLGAFIGVPYVWGGKSPKGFDCSGLVQFVFGLHGIRLPRDSDQQFACGDAVGEPQPGDLLFFGRERISHVGVAADAGEFLHARGDVRRNSLDPGAARHDAELAALLRGARRVLPRPA